jgi:uncharacterized membrane-anchored protein
LLQKQVAIIITPALQMPTCNRSQDHQHIMEKPNIPNGNTVAEQVSKVAAITFSFWILKIATTTVGDLSGDMLSITLGLGYVTALIVVLAVIATLLIAQLSAKRFHPLLYWVLILLSSTVGAEFSDTIDRTLHWGTVIGAGMLLVCFAATLAIWYIRCGEIGIYPINEREDELFYWVAVIFANTLGSVVGDLLGDRLGFGVLQGIAVNIGVLAVLTMLRYKTKVNRGLLFWIAFVFARVSF